MTYEHKSEERINIHMHIIAEDISHFMFIFRGSCESQVNKPYLPLASGEYSVKTGVMIVSSFAIIVSSMLVHEFPLLIIFVYPARRLCTLL